MLLFLLLVAASITRAAAYSTNIRDFDWSTVKPSANLSYTNCYDGLKCAKLLVPLDWLDEQNPERVTLAITARPAVVAENDPSFGGTIIANPGGPGGDGISLILFRGKLLQQIADGNKKYEILSFDPRGVGRTTPSADCYQNEFSRATFQQQTRIMGGPDQGSNALRQYFSRAHGHGALCAENADIMGFMSTSSVARDMVQIVDQLHELRHSSNKMDQGEGLPRVELRSSADKTPRIQYWGFSYGTVLGRYFASMFPGRVGRMILEAVEDVYDYSSATWSENLADVQKALEHLWETCYEADARCALYEKTDTGPHDIRDRVEKFMDELEAAPIPYLLDNSVVTMTKNDIVFAIFQSLYSPSDLFPNIARAIASAMRGDYAMLFVFVNIPGRSLGCPLEPKLDTYTWGKDAQAGIACGDGEPQTNLSMAGFQEHLAKLQGDSPHFGPYWSTIRLACTGWRVRPKHRFTGPWKTPEPDNTPVEGKPAAPLLFVSSAIDPVTPLRMAEAARKDHPGSGLLVQDNVGHATATAAGTCRDNYVKKYWEHGTIPPEGTVCKQDWRPFLQCPQAAAAGQHTRDARWYPMGII
ncbi:TAP-like protein-domain-containing protein [Stachybotrys elegans]|uniref:TAP-like protein-domain-containing protein n=1 Tax=Stachybotrys elegans TaxID=80388 RepID=A0A8K0WSI5_9HYPO|nr:TAP-like protein-domain-containing protein [Stachybotrys elegans]